MDTTWMKDLPDGGAWTVIAVLAAAVFGAPALLSQQTIRQKLGALLWLPRLRSRWRREALEEDSAREAAAVQALEGRIDALQRSAAEDRRWWEDRYERLRKDLARVEAEGRAREEQLQRDLADALGYIRWVTDWARGVRIWADEAGVELPPPPWRGFLEWSRDHRTVVPRSSDRPREPPAG